jgi:carbon-monoxide dehydrogenase small subunit
MILSAKALLDVNPNPTLEEIKVGLSGNLCRCTGYTKIFKAVKLSAKKLSKENVDDGGES